MGLHRDVSADVVPVTPTNHSDENVQTKPHKWYYYLWDTLDKPKEERWFMFKLDAALLTFASLGIAPPLPPVTTFTHRSQVILSNILTKRTSTVRLYLECTY